MRLNNYCENNGCGKKKKKKCLQNVIFSLR